MDKAKVYIEANKERFLNELFDLIRIPSVSAEAVSYTHLTLPTT